MQKAFTKKGFLLFTLLFIFIAAFSFAAFRETEQVCANAKTGCPVLNHAKSSDMIWEVISRRFLSLVSI